MKRTWIRKVVWTFLAAFLIGCAVGVFPAVSNSSLAKSLGLDVKQTTNFKVPGESEFPVLGDNQFEEALVALAQAEVKAYEKEETYVPLDKLAAYGFGEEALAEIKDTVRRMDGSPLFPPSKAVDEPEVQLLLPFEGQGYVFLARKHRMPFYSLPLKKDDPYSQVSFAVGYDAIIIMSPGMLKIAILRPDLFPRVKDPIAEKLMAEEDSKQVMNELWTRYVASMSKVNGLKLID
jgi:hypothetical protein